MHHTFAELLRSYRERASLKKQELAQLLRVHRNTVHAWERGDYLPQTRDVVLQLAVELQVTPQEKDKLLRAAGHLPDDRLIEDEAQELLQSLPLDSIPTVTSLPQPHRMTRRPNNLFVGRTQELAGIARVLKGESSRRIGQIVVVHGMGGVGKTELAAEFAHRYGQFFAGGVFWLDFADSFNIRAEVAACGGQQTMNLPGFRTLKFDEQVERVLREWERPTPRLLIFDNCEDEKLLEQWMPTTGGCRVLVTSRRAQWNLKSSIGLIALDVLPRAESIAFLLKCRPDLSAKQPILGAIADGVGDLPLALNLASQFLIRYKEGLTPEAYLAQLQSKVQEGQPVPQIDASQEDPSSDLLPVWHTFTLSYSKLDDEIALDRMAKSLLIRASCFAVGNPFPRSLLLMTITQYTDQTDVILEFEDALARLMELGLMQQDGVGNILLHRLLVSFLQNIYNEVDMRAVETTAISILQRINKVEHLLQGLNLLQHVRSIVDVSISRKDKHASSLCTSLGYYLKSIGEYAQAEIYFEHALAISVALLGPIHPTVATNLNNLGFVLQEQGYLDKAQPYYLQSLAIREQILGELDLDIASSLNNLGYLYQAQGNYIEAQQYFERSLAIREQVLGAEHADTANSLNNLGFALQEQGHLDKALPYYQRALSVREKMLGLDHPDRANSLNNIGYLLQAQGKFREAQSYFQDAFDVFKRIFGVDHPDTANTLNNFGFVLHKQGYFQEARPLYQQALSIREQKLGSKHPDTANSLNNIAMLHFDEGQFEEAAILMRRALSIREQVLGESHPETHTTRKNLLFIEKQLRLTDKRDNIAQIAKFVTNIELKVNKFLSSKDNKERIKLVTAIDGLVEWIEKTSNTDPSYHSYIIHLRELARQLRESIDH